jgi:hypothetical protein
MKNNTDREFELEQENIELKLRIKELEALVEELRIKLNKNSNNSSKPPSSDGLKKKLNSRVKSARSCGGQKGHKGSTLELPENLDELIESGKIEVVVKDYTNGADDYISRWTVDVEVRTIYTEYRFSTDAEIPEELGSNITYGSEVKALSVLLSTEGMLSHKRLASFFTETTEGLVSPSESTINAFLQEAAKNCNTDELVEDVLAGEVMNVDETPMRSTERPQEEGKGGLILDENNEIKMETAENKSFQVYVRTYSNDTTTILTVNGRKNEAGVIRDGILPNYNGTVSQDYEAKFLKYGGQTALCGQHLERELKGLFDCVPIRAWSESALAFMQRMCHHKNEDMRNDITSCDPVLLDSFITEYRNILAQGQECLNTIDNKDSDILKKAKNLIKRMRGTKTNICSL